MKTRDFLRATSVLAVLMAGSCSDSSNTALVTPDGAANHPITVEPSYRSLKLSDSNSLSNEDAAKLEAFVGDYMARGNGAISISVPPGPGSSQTITALGERISDLGVPRSRILVGVQDQSGADARIEIGYVTYKAHTDTCGDWSVEAADNTDNQTMPNFGCSVQNNIAAQLADPRDAMEPRTLGPSDATRRMQVLGKYEQGQSTAAQVTKAQSGAVSDVNNQ